MKLHKLCAALSLAFFTPSPTAYAIDQVILKNGDVIEGKILSDVPNRHVDIQLINGNKKRYSQTDVASLERDVPSNADRRMSGNESEFYLAPQLGANFSLETGGTTDFIWGARAGVNATQLGDFSKLAIGLTFLHSQSSTTISTTTLTAATNQVLVQMLFRKVGNTGFFFGPELGLSFLSLTATGSTVSVTGSAFTFGLDVGYDYYVSDGFSFGPDVHWTNVTATTLTASTGGTLAINSSNSISALFNFTFHL
jgi:hypothetical protein